MGIALTGTGEVPTTVAWTVLKLLFLAERLTRALVLHPIVRRSPVILLLTPEEPGEVLTPVPIPYPEVTLTVTGLKPGRPTPVGTTTCFCVILL